MITDVADTGGRFLHDLLALTVDINQVDPDPENVNVHPEWQIEELRDTLRTYGQHRALVVNERNGRLICRIGNGVLEAARREGWTRIAVVRANESEVKLKARAIRDNTASWGSQFDDSELRRQLAEIKKFDSDLVTGLGWNESEISLLLGKTDNSYLAKALNGASQQTEDTVEDSKVDEDLEEISEEELEDDYTPPPPKPQPLPVLNQGEPSRIIVNALQAAEYLSMMPGVSAELLQVFCDLFNPAVFEPVYGENKQLVRVICKVPLDA